MIRVVANEHDFYVPTFEVEINERETDREVIRDVIQVTYKDDVDQIDSFKLTINNWDAEKHELKYTDRDIFDPGKQLTLRMGYRGKDGAKPPLMIRGIVKSLQYNYPPSGGPTVAISGQNVLSELQDEQRQEDPFERLKLSQIAEQVLGKREVSLQTNPDPTKESRPLDSISQENKTDLVFLKELAETVGYELVVIEEESGSVIYFGPTRSINEVTYQLVYGAGMPRPGARQSGGASTSRAPSLIQFSTTLNTTDQKGAVEYASTHPTSGEDIKVVVKRSSVTDRPKLNDNSRQRSLEKLFDNRIEKISTPPVESLQQAQEKASGALTKIAREMIKGTGSTIGLPNLRAGTYVHIDGIGEHFKGKYFVTGTTHPIGTGGYTTQFECRREDPKGR